MALTLCLDAGNTRLKCGLHDGSQWLMQGALTYEAFDDLPSALPERPDRILACNVAGPAAAMRIDALARLLDLPLTWFRSAAAGGGVHNGYREPERLGADRWAALVAARAIDPGPCLVVLAGTATTIDALDGAGRFLGGLILPGLDLMRATLARNTADLPPPELAAGHYRRFPTGTEDAIISGAIHATLGAMGRLRDAMAETGEEPLCLLSGGAAEQLAAHIPFPFRPVDNLVLEGLARHGATL